MNCISREQKLLFTIYYLSQYLDCKPRFDKFDREEILISFPATSCNLYSILEDMEELIKDINEEFKLYFSGYDNEQQYIETQLIKKKSIINNRLEFSLPYKDGFITDLMLRIFIEEETDRDNLFSVLSSIEFNQTRFVLKKNNYTLSHFKANFEGSCFIFLGTDDEGIASLDGVINNLNIENLKQLFNVYFKTGQDCVEFYYIYKDYKKSSALFIALRKSLRENDIKIEKRGERVEFFSGDRKLLFNYDKNCYAEKVMLSLLFDSENTQGIKSLCISKEA